MYEVEVVNRRIILEFIVDHQMGLFGDSILAPFHFEMPEGAVIMDFGIRVNKLTLWVLADPYAKKRVNRYFKVFKTGEGFSVQHDEQLTYVTSCVFGIMGVRHIFETTHASDKSLPEGKVEQLIDG